LSVAGRWTVIVVASWLLDLDRCRFVVVLALVVVASPLP
jgi:hypothetical protein